MKKLLTLKNLLLVLGVALAIAAFAISFGSGIFAKNVTWSVGGIPITFDRLELKPLIFGQEKVITTIAGVTETADVENGVKVGLAVAGVLFIFIPALLCFAAKLLISNNKWYKTIVCVLCLIIGIGSIFTFMLKDAYVVAEAFANGVNVKVARENYSAFGLNACAIISPLFGLISGGAILASLLVKEKQFIKEKAE